MNFLSELSRRNVIRVAGIYAIIGWIIVQVITTIAPLLGLPDWFGTAVLVLLMAGFPIVALGAWAFELTPDGLKREEERAPADADTSLHGMDIAILVGLVMLVGVGFWMNVSQAPTVIVAEDVVIAEDSSTSIAVLAFEDLSQEQDQEYFADGISEEILNLLVRVEGLQVASRTSSFQYKNQSLGISEIAEDLGVGHVLEGSVRRSGDRIRITAQLIDARTDRHLWSDNFDRDMTDIFAIQDEIADAIVGALAESLGLSPEEANVDVVVVTENLDAYDAYIRGREYFLARINIEQAITLLEYAVELDPDFAEAWEILAFCHAIANSWTDRTVDSQLPLILAAANRALELNPNSSHAYAAMGAAADSSQGNPLASRRHFDRALELDPDNIIPLNWRATEMASFGLIEEARIDLERCLEIDPAYTKCRNDIVEVYYILGEHELALDALYRTLESGYGLLSNATFDVLIANGRREEAMFHIGGIMGYDFAWGPLVDTLIDPASHNVEHAYAMATTFAASNPDVLTPANMYILATRLGIEPLPELTLEVIGGLNIWHPEMGEVRRSEFFKGLAAEFNVLSYWQTYGFPSQCRPVSVDGDEDSFVCD